MNKIKLPPQYKDYYHLKEEDLERLNRHIEHFEKDQRRKKYLRRWIFMPFIAIVIVMFLLGVIDLNDIKNLFVRDNFLIKDVIEGDNFKYNIRISRPHKDKVSIIFEPVLPNGITIEITNRYGSRRILAPIDVGITDIRYDRYITIIYNGSSKTINIENLKVME